VNRLTSEPPPKRLPAFDLWGCGFHSTSRSGIRLRENALSRRPSDCRSRRRQQFAQRFLAERITPEDELEVKNLTAAGVTAFLLRECARLKLSSAECYANGLGSLLRFLHASGYTARVLADCVPSVASWRDAGVSKGVASARRRAYASVM
jgi:hypothetical protein